MFTSRRKFLRAGILATLFAAVPVKSIFSQGKGKDHVPPPQPPGQRDVLADYTKASFEPYLNSIFRLQTGFSSIEVTLTSIDDMPAPKGGECFALVFRGGSTELPQGTYEIDHPALGTFLLLVVPSGADRNGAEGYVATINRLSYADAVNAGTPAIGAPTTNSKPKTKQVPQNKPDVKPSPIKKKPSLLEMDLEDLPIVDKSSVRFY